MGKRSRKQCFVCLGCGRCNKERIAKAGMEDKRAEVDKKASKDVRK